MAQVRWNIVRAALLGGIVAGTIDLGAACIITGRSLPFILHAVAGGLLAQRSFSGGTPTAILGLVLQEAMGILIAAIYVIAAQSIPILNRRWVTLGLLYGVAIFFVMNYVVVPLSAWHRAPNFSFQQFAANLAAMLLFGLIVAFFSSRSSIR
jgi:uncharacterized membrane protein YagU involved in acid resistance